ncbi:phage holin family protein [Candidatus Binatia bacterium]|nr:phage holin family protein [Candidatus Binatia bacterium]
MIGAVVDVLDAGQRVILDRIELLSIEVRAAGSSALASLAFVLFGLGLLLVGWVAGNALAVVLIARIWSSAEGLAVVAGVNLAGGALALLLARRRATAAAAPARNTNGHDAEASSEGGATA